MKIRITPSQAAMLTKLPNGKSTFSGKDYRKKKYNIENINIGDTSTNNTQPQSPKNGPANEKV